jgi:flagellar hook protein FlgE
VNLPSLSATATTAIMNLEVVDSQGNGQNVTLTWTKTAVANQWSIALSSASAASITRSDTAAAYSGATAVLANFNTDGTLAGFNAGMTATPPDAIIAWNPVGTLANTTLAFDFGAVGSTTGTRIMGPDFLIQQNDNDGRAFATVDTNYIDQDGFVSTIFRNSSSLKIYQIAVSNFNAANRLQPQSGNSFTQTNTSGNHVLGFANTSGNAAIISGRVETNPVSLAQQLTHLIEIQHWNSAIVRTITAENPALQELQKI